MNKTVKKILKIFLIMLCAFILFEICGAVVNIIAVRSQHKKVIEIVENNGGDVWEIYSCVLADHIDKILFAGTDVIIHSENIDIVSSTLEKEFPFDDKEGCWSIGVHTHSLDPFEPLHWAIGDTDYSKFYEEINAKLKRCNTENYYIITIGDNLPFEHNIISYYLIMEKSIY